MSADPIVGRERRGVPRLGPVLRLLGAVCLALALLALGAGLAAALLDWPAALGSTGQFWYDLDPASLNLVQAVTERYLAIELWDHLLFPLLEQPLLVTLAILAAFFGLLGLALRRLGRR